MNAKQPARYKRLRVHLRRRARDEQEFVGVLALHDGRCLFEYDAAFRVTGTPVSPRLSFENPTAVASRNDVTAPFFGLHGVFADSLPDGWGLRVMGHAFRTRGLLERDLTPIDRLAFLGDRTMGALVYEPEYDVGSQERSAVDLAALYEEVQVVLHGEASSVLQRLIDVGVSPGGARPKVLVGVPTEAAAEGTTSSFAPFKGEVISGTSELPDGYEHWIVKFRAEGDKEYETELEHLYALAAKRAGIEMEPTRLFRDASGGVWFGTRRFDRKADGERVHQVSLAGLTDTNFRIPQLDYEKVIRITRGLTKSDLQVRKMFALAVFNAVFHNRDDHGKNFTFQQNARAEWSLSPAYDLTYTHGPGGWHTTTYLNEGVRVDVELLMRIAMHVSVDQSFAKQTIESLFEAREWMVREARTFVPKAELAQMQQAFTKWSRPELSLRAPGTQPDSESTAAATRKCAYPGCASPIAKGRKRYCKDHGAMSDRGELARR
jgi:serine/threonine-protein kinase HipA